MNKYKPLFESFKLGKHTLSNRFVLSPMTLSLTTIDGKMTSQEANYALRRSNSAPIAVTGAAYIDEFGQLFEYGYSAKEDSDIESLKVLANAMKANGNLAILQLGHAGKFSQASLKNMAIYMAQVMRKIISLLNMKFLNSLINKSRKSLILMQMQH